MKKATVIWIIVLVVVIGAGAYIYLNNLSTVSPQTPVVQNTTPTTTPVAPVATPLLDVTSSPTLGMYITAADGMTLYTYKKDSTNTSNCYNQCATIWPPYTILVNPKLVANPSITGEISTITRTDGTFQVTYKGQPLYLYSKDVNPGDTKGQGVSGLWYVATP